MKHRKTEQGQALVLIVFAIIGLVGVTGLVIDGGIAYVDNRNAQSAADSAAFAAALAKVRGNTVGTAALTAAQVNGYDNAQVTVNTPPGAGCDGQSSPYSGNTEYIQVLVNSQVDTAFSPIVGIQELNNCVEAVVRATPPTTATPFDGNAVVGLDPSGYSFDAWGNSDWYIYGGGVFANANARGKNNKDNVIFPDGDCVTAVGTALYFSCPVSNGNSGLAYSYPSDITPLLPPIPPCDGVAYRGTDGLMYPEAGKEATGSIVDHFEDNYAPGLYCITDANGNFHNTTTGTNVTFYIMDTDFTMKFNGGGGMALQAPTSGPYKGILMFSNVTATPCTQNVEFRGNGTADNIGTIFMPSACIDARGNSGVAQNRSQLIGYRVTSNGTGDVTVNFNPDDNYKAPIPPKITLIK